MLASSAKYPLAALFSPVGAGFEAPGTVRDSRNRHAPIQHDASPAVLRSPQSR